MNHSDESPKPKQEIALGCDAISGILVACLAVSSITCVSSGRMR